MAQGTSKAKDQAGEYTVTGGESGEASIEIDGKRYFPGDKVKIDKSDLWLVEQGYVAKGGKSDRTEEPDPEPEAPGDDIEEDEG